LVGILTTASTASRIKRQLLRLLLNPLLLPNPSRPPLLLVPEAAKVTVTTANTDTVIMEATDTLPPPPLPTPRLALPLPMLHPLLNPTSPPLLHVPEAAKVTVITVNTDTVIMEVTDTLLLLLPPPTLLRLALPLPMPHPLLNPSSRPLLLVPEENMAEATVTTANTDTVIMEATDTRPPLPPLTLLRLVLQLPMLHLLRTHRLPLPLRLMLLHEDYRANRVR